MIKILTRRCDICQILIGKNSGIQHYFPKITQREKFHYLIYSFKLYYSSF